MKYLRSALRVPTKGKEILDPPSSLPLAPFGPARELCEEVMEESRFRMSGRAEDGRGYSSPVPAPALLVMALSLHCG